MASLNTRYLGTNRGIIKILQIVFGFVICSFLCGNWYGGRTCFGETRLGYISGLNFVLVVINIVLFVINCVDLGMWKERIYSIISAICLLIAIIILIWYIIEYNDSRGWRIPVLIFVFIEFLLYCWDVNILQGEAPN